MKNIWSGVKKKLLRVPKAKTAKALDVSLRTLFRKVESGNVELDTSRT